MVAQAVVNNIRKPDTDTHREYRFLKLFNELGVLLISDSKCDKASACLDVRVGSAFDPPELPGLAHFLEHMLFLGTEKFPDESSYNKYLNENGGYSNAYTTDDHTCYYFCVSPEGLPEALDRFSQFFISPLFDQSATDRELKAVDSEHNKNLQADVWRTAQLMRTQCNPKHPINRFTTGNSTTLCDEPAKKGIDVRSELLSFHKKFYSANVMRAVVLGKEPLDELQVMAENCFGDILNKNVAIPWGEELTEEPVFTEGKLPLEVLQVPVRDIKQLDISWALEELSQHWRTKPASYASHLIGHEGKGSLLSALKREDLAAALSAGVMMEGSGVSAFSVTTTLTPKGASIEGVKRVGELVFGFIRLLQISGVQEWVFKEEKKIHDIEFKFRNVRDAMSVVTSCANNLHRYPPELVLEGPETFFDFDSALIKTKVLDLLTVDSARVCFTDKALASACGCTEPIYGTQYAEQKLRGELSSAWHKVGSMTGEETQEFCKTNGLAFPEQNPFIAEDLLVKPPEEGPKQYPEKISLGVPELEKFASIYFKKDDTFGLPKGVWTLTLHSSFVSASFENAMKTSLWAHCVEEDLNEFAYDAEVAGLVYNLIPKYTGITLSVRGWSDSLPRLLSAIGTKLRDYTPDQQTFDRVREMRIRQLRNAAENSQPYQQAYQRSFSAMETPFYTFEERLSFVEEKLTSPDQVNVGKEILSETFIEGLILGNFTRSEVASHMSAFLRLLPLKTVPSKLKTSEVVDLSSVPLPLPSSPQVTSTPFFRNVADTTNADDPNSAVLLEIQVGDSRDVKLCALLSVSASFLEQKFFDDLRTKQQLGYIVTSQPNVGPSACSLFFIIQSLRKGGVLRLRVEKFLLENLAEGGALRAELNEESFEKHKASVLSVKKRQPKSLKEESDRHLPQVFRRSFAFDRREREIKALEALSFEEFRDFAGERLLSLPRIAVEMNASAASGLAAVPSPGPTQDEEDGEEGEGDENGVSCAPVEASEEDMKAEAAEAEKVAAAYATIENAELLSGKFRETAKKTFAIPSQVTI